MKFKYYLRGCGLGILIAVVVLMVALHKRGGVMTDEKAMERAAELGMIMPDDTEEGMESVIETEESTQTAVPVVKNDTESDKNTDVSKKPAADSTEENDPSGNDTKKENDSETENNSETESSNEDETITITVKRGEYCRQISEKLYKNGLVADAEEFRKYMQDNDYDNMIYAGTFSFKKGMTYKQIAKILTTKPE